MNAERLIELYERVADAPDAVKRLRRFVLNLAVRGKLVDQRHDERQTAELAHLQQTTINEAPNSWFHSKVGELTVFNYGKGLKKADRLEAGPVPVFGSNGIVGYTDSATAEKSALIVGRKGSAGALNLADGSSWTTDVAYYIEPPAYFELRYLFVALSTLNLGRLGKGVKPGLSRADAYELPLAVPPLAEQHRIVAKVDELMALCDRLQATHNTREATRDRLTTATLARLATINNAERAFGSAANFALINLSAITNKSAQVERIRRTIIDLALRGRLHAADRISESASYLLERSQQEIDTYAKSNKIRQTKVDPVEADDAPFSIPPNWKWTRLAHLFRVITDGDHQAPPRAESGVAFLTIGNITTGHLVFDGCRLVPKDYFDAIATYRKPQEGDILYTVVGATFGRPAPVDTDRKFCVQRHIAILKPVSLLAQRFLLLLLSSPSTYEQAARSTTGTAQPTIPLTRLRNFAVPLPPVAEQHRIVAKVDELMALCDRLEASLQQADEKRARLLNALLAEALAPSSDARSAA